MILTLWTSSTSTWRKLRRLVSSTPTPLINSNSLQLDAWCGSGADEAIHRMLQKGESGHYQAKSSATGGYLRCFFLSLRMSFCVFRHLRVFSIFAYCTIKHSAPTGVELKHSGFTTLRSVPVFCQLSNGPNNTTSHVTCLIHCPPLIDHRSKFERSITTVTKLLCLSDCLIRNCPFVNVYSELRAGI